MEEKVKVGKELARKLKELNPGEDIRYNGCQEVMFMSCNPEMLEYPKDAYWDAGKNKIVCQEMEFMPWSNE